MSLIIYLRCECKNLILQRVQLAGAENANITRFTTSEAELLVAPKICVQMAENTSGLDFNWRHFGNGLDVKSMIGELVADVVVVGNDDDLHDNLKTMRFNTSTF